MAEKRRTEFDGISVNCNSLPAYFVEINVFVVHVVHINLHSASSVVFCAIVFVGRTVNALGML